LCLPLWNGSIQKKLIDVGCGVGAWLAIFKAAGVPEILGIDGDYVARDMLMIPQECFAAHDLTKPYHSNKQFDMAVSLEVAEHLPPERAEGFVDLLSSLAPVILFSAAVPGQGGMSHLNEQWLDYWAPFFAKRGYVLVDCIRARFWENSRVRWWYRQNSVLFVRKEKLAEYPLLQKEYERSSAMPLRLVHPMMYAGLRYATNPDTMPVDVSWKILKQTVSRAVSRRVRMIYPARSQPIASVQQT